MVEEKKPKQVKEKKTKAKVVAEKPAATEAAPKATAKQPALKQGSVKTNTAKQIRQRRKENKVKLEPWDVIFYPHLAEKSMSLVDMQNKIVFIVNPMCDKNQIKKATEELFNVKVKNVKTELTPYGQKKAYVKLHDNYSAADIASRLGVL